MSAALIVASVASFVQVMQIKIPRTRFVIGSGLLSVMGVSFSFVPVAQQVIGTLSQCTCAGVPCTVGHTCAACASALVGKCLTPEAAYGKVLGTVSTIDPLVLVLQSSRIRLCCEMALGSENGSFAYTTSVCRF